MLRNSVTTDTFGKHVQRVHSVRWVEHRTGLENACKTFIASRDDQAAGRRRAPAKDDASTVGQSASRDKRPAGLSSIPAGKRRSHVDPSLSTPVGHPKRARKDRNISEEPAGRSRSSSANDLYKNPTPPYVPGGTASHGQNRSSPQPAREHSPSTHQLKTRANAPSSPSGRPLSGPPVPLRSLSQQSGSVRLGSGSLPPYAYHASSTGSRPTTPGGGAARPPARSGRDLRGKRASSTGSNDSFGTQWVQGVAAMNAGSAHSTENRGRSQYRKGSPSAGSSSPAPSISAAARYPSPRTLSVFRKAAQEGLDELADISSRDSSPAIRPPGAGPPSRGSQASGSRPPQPSQSRPVGTASSSPSRSASSARAGRR